ncbi:MAG: oligosaccharide flippase family protein [Streptosporangiaceae bacterium]|nr:oligosaccharide flippase family protein [Streptosporangiaceae bacterium]
MRRGTLWSALSTLVLRFANIGITAVVAHILSPRDFGIFTVALTAYTIVSSLGELGIASCLIRADLDIEEIAPTMVTVSWTTSAIFASAMAISAQRIAAALGSTDGAEPIRIMALTVLISGVFAVPGAQLTRDFKQDKLFLANVISIVPSTALLFVLAKSGSGAMAFAWSRVVAQFLMGCVMAMSVPKIYMPGISRDALSVLGKFGLPMAGANFINFVLLNVDYAFVGHLIGAVALGAYVLAFTVASAPSLLLGTVINNVAMPAFSRVKHDSALLQKSMASALRAVSLILMPMCAMLMVLASPLVLTLYGAKWARSAEVLSILSLYGAISIICVLFANMLTSLGRARLILLVQLLWLGALVPAMAFGVHRDGIVGAAFAHIAIIGPLVLPCYVFVLRRATGVRLFTLGKAIAPPLLAAVVAAAAARGAASQFTRPLEQLVLGGMAGGLIYVLAVAPQAVALLGAERAAKILRLPVFRLYGIAAPPVPTVTAASTAMGASAVMAVPSARPSAGGGRELDGAGEPGGAGELAGAGGQRRTGDADGAWLAGPFEHVAPLYQDHLLVPHIPPGSVSAFTGGRAPARPTIPAPSIGRIQVRGATRAALLRERAVRRRVSLAWALLILNCLTYYGALVHVPSAGGKAITQGALPAALIVALTVNRRLVVRPNIFLCLVTLLVVEAIITTLQPQHVGQVYRTFRLAEFVVVLWLLSPWWGRRDLLLVRTHLISLSVILGSVVLGLFIAPGKARSGGRLGGVIWAIPATQVAHYAAITAGLVVVLWLSGQLRGKVTAVIGGTSVVVLVLTHTRTALVGLIIGILVAGLSLIVAKARARKFFMGVGALAALAILTLSSFLSSWLARGEGTQELYNLTGRTKVWGPLLAFPRDRFQEIFGFGLSNSSFNGLAIDSNWLASYQEQGLIGVAICVIMLVFLLVAAYFQPRGVKRALALFLVTYCLVASFTEVGFTDASMYLLELTLAASLLVPSARDRQLR